MSAKQTEQSNGSPSSPAPIAIMLRIWLDWFTSSRPALIRHIDVHITFSSMTSQPPRQPESRRGDLQEGEAASFSSEWANGGYVNGAGDYGITTRLTVITDVGKRALRACLMLSYSYDDRSSSAFDTDDGGNNVFCAVVGPRSDSHTGPNTHSNVYTVLELNPQRGLLTR